MTTEMERKFLEAFGIEPKKVEISCNECASRMEECGCFDCEKEIYPEITDHILLELICIESRINKAHNTYGDVENLKEHILVGLENNKEKIYNEVRAVFGLESEEK